MLRVGSVLHSLQDKDSSPGATAFVEATIPKLLANFDEVVSNASTAGQSGVIAGAFVLVALTPAILRQFPSSSVHGSLTKANILTQAQSLATKQAFLLNHRIYSKFTSEDASGGSV